MFRSLYLDRFLGYLAGYNSQVPPHPKRTLTPLLPEQFTEFYYNQFDADRKQLGVLYVSYKKFQYKDSANSLQAWYLHADLRVQLHRWLNRYCWEAFRKNSISLACVIIYLTIYFTLESPIPASQTSSPHPRRSTLWRTWWGSDLGNWCAIGRSCMAYTSKTWWMHNFNCVIAGQKADWKKLLGRRGAATYELHSDIPTYARWRRKLLHLQRHLQVGLRITGRIWKGAWSGI